MRYLLRRLLQLIPTLLGIVTLTFVIVHAAPGGPLVALSGEFSTAEYQRTVQALYGLDRSLPEQYLRYLGNVLTGDLGQSYFYKQAVLAVMLDRLPATLLLMLPAFTLSSLLGIWLGLAAVKRSDPQEASASCLTALAKGLGERAALRTHALQNALLPIVTIIGGRIGFIFAGAVLVETVFAWPGLGRLVVSASLNRDYPVLLGLFLCISAMTLIVNLVTDFLYPVIDRRIRQGEHAIA